KKPQKKQKKWKKLQKPKKLKKLQKNSVLISIHWIEKLSEPLSHQLGSDRRGQTKKEIRLYLDLYILIRHDSDLVVVYSKRS
ncbi:MAG: hypothetical protein KAT69_05450, partial [Candidatus Aminicenantes bacterium]|nr:hypothetical protein [Candidatus Aminicenantes bacterium]